MALTDDELRTMTADELETLIIEEASEVIHAACKSRRFGRLGSHPSYNEGRSNADGVVREFVQLRQTIRIYCGKVTINFGDAMSTPEYELSDLAKDT